jgi:hypothetical protein
VGSLLSQVAATATKTCVFVFLAKMRRSLACLGVRQKDLDFGMAATVVFSGDWSIVEADGQLLGKLFGRLRDSRLFQGGQTECVRFVGSSRGA